MLDVTLDVHDRAGGPRVDAAHDDARDVPPDGEHRLSVDERCRGDHAVHRPDAPDHVRLVLDRAAVAHHHDVRVEAEDLVAQILLEAGHDGEHDVQRGDADRHPEERDGGDEGEERAAPAGAEVTEADEEFPAHDVGSGRSCGKRITSRMEVAPVSTITRRSTPMPSPAVGGSPCSSARR